MSKPTVKFFPLPWSVASIPDLTSGAKALYAKLNSDACGRNWCRVGVGSLANALGVSNETIRRWRRELERLGLIRIRHDRAVCCYYINPKYRSAEGFIPLLSETMKRRDVGWAYKLVLCWLSYRQGSNDYCWAKQKAITEDLGVSVRTIERVLSAAKAKGELQIRMRRRNRKQGNKYLLTCGAVLGGRVFGANSHATKCAPLYKKRKAKTISKAFASRRPKFPSRGLSEVSSRDGFGMEAVYFELVNVGVHEKVARPLAFDDKHPFESVVQAINNGHILRATVWKRALDAKLPRPKFRLPGYVVAALNGSRREGKVIGTTKLFRSAAAMSRAIKLAKTRRGRWRPISEKEFAARVRKTKIALGIPA